MSNWVPWKRRSERPKVAYLPQPPTAVPDSSEAQGGETEHLKCSFCRRPTEHVDHLVAGHEAAICSDCLTLAQQALKDANSGGQEDSERVLDLYRFHFRDARRERQFLASVSFFVTFASVRWIVRSIQEGRGPFHNVSAGGKHIHHLVWGILTLLGVGYVWLLQIGTGTTPPRSWMRQTAILYGAGSALTLDEFALWLNLSDVYFTKEGRESVDAVILFGSVLSVGFWGRPFLHSLARLFIHKAKKVGTQP